MTGLLSEHSYPKIKIEELRVGRTKTSLVSAEHEPVAKKPSIWEWNIIRGRIECSNLLFVEYFPHELRATTYHKPLVGVIARSYSQDHGIDSFFDRVSGIAHQSEVPIAVADIANKPLYEAYYGAMKYGPLASGAIDIIKAVKDPSQRIRALRGIVRIAYTFMQAYQESFQNGIFNNQRLSVFDRFLINLEDGRRIFTARALQQEAERRSRNDKPWSDDLAYIGPRAHTLRIKHHLLNPKDPSANIRAQIYYALPGLDFSIRVYEPDNNSWRQTANIPIAV